jgi:glycine dehydrogenase
MAAFYAIYHGPDRMTAIADRIHHMAVYTADILAQHGYTISTTLSNNSQPPANGFFDTFVVTLRGNETAAAIQAKAVQEGVNVRVIDSKHIGISLGESIVADDVAALLRAFSISTPTAREVTSNIHPSLHRASAILTHPVFNTHHSETQMLRYMKSLENKDLSLNYSMISLGSCTMKLNATNEMVPVTWNETCNLHPFAPEDQAKGEYATGGSDWGLGARARGLSPVHHCCPSFTVKLGLTPQIWTSRGLSSHLRYLALSS